MIKIVSFSGNSPIGYLQSKIGHHLQQLLEDGSSIFSPCEGVRIGITPPNTFFVEDGDMIGTGAYLTQKWGITWYGPMGMSCTICATPAEALEEKSFLLSASFTVSHIQEVWV